MFHVHDILFGVSLALGACLVLASALGMSDAFGESDSAFEGVDTGPDGADGDASSALGLLGLGRVPLLIVWMLSSLLFGGTGLVISPILQHSFGGALAAGLSLTAAAIVAFLGTRVLSRWLARALPSVESYAGRKVDLVGTDGTVLVVGRRGDVVLRVMDAGGAEMRVLGDRGPRTLVAGDRVCLVAYDRARDRFEVERVSEA